MMSSPRGWGIFAGTHDSRGGPRRTRAALVAIFLSLLVGLGALFALAHSSRASDWGLSNRIAPTHAAAAGQYVPPPPPRVPPWHIPLPPPVASVSGCPGTTEVLVDNLGYYSTCNVTLSWPSGFPVSTPVINVTLAGVALSVYAYETMDCPVLSVTGHETGGTVQTFLIYPTPVNCEWNTPTVFSADGTFGATWTGGPAVELYVWDGVSP